MHSLWIKKTEWFIKCAISLNSSCDKIQPIRSNRNKTFDMRGIKSKEKTKTKHNSTACKKSIKKEATTVKRAFILVIYYTYFVI